MPQAVLKMVDICKSYHEIRVLSGINLELYPGQICALLGSNGAGKSTLTKIMTGEVRMTSGKICMDGREVEINSPYAAKKLGIISCPQEVTIFGELSVTENLFLGSELRRKGVLDWHAMEQETQAILDKLGIDVEPRRKASRLSMAEKYLLQFARTLIRDYKVIVLDELTDSLTMSEVARLYSLLRELKARGVAVVYITHRIEEARKISDRITVMKDGEIMDSIAPQNAEREELAHKMLGEDIKEHYPKLSVAKGNVVLQARGLRNKFVSDISFSLRSGEVLGIAGLVGSGRTNLLKAIVGLDKLDEGNVSVMSGGTGADGIRANIGFIPENRDTQGLFMDMSVAQNITIKRLKGISKGRLIMPRDEEEKSWDYIERLGIKPRNAHQKVRYLSGGNKQKTLVARNVFSRCNIYIFDEPTKGVDIAGKVEIYNIINELIRKKAGIVLVSSDFSELAGMCDRVLVIRNGKLVGELKQSELSHQRLFDLCKE
ncbi:sugar ABC transporter ATP-binding protein [Christensenella timonensis]|uniref:sugar ABC transporter ATP-binding protein n=1 Tax=Christensenella timonensis TaxID=1816678 RepID=UPI00082B02CD|nr:sugar ABC transporter ATP-binding protein [Christensenella timonensis]